jgi:hypothetical protein
MTLLAPAVGPYLVFGPVAATSDKPMLAASTDRAVPDLDLFVHAEIFLLPLF